MSRPSASRRRYGASRTSDVNSGASRESRRRRLRSGDSEVDDPEQDEESKFNDEVDNGVSSEAGSEEVLKLQEEIAKLKEENKLQEEYLLQKDEEKREAIRQLSFTVDMLKEDNMKLRKLVAAKETPKIQSPIEFIKSKEGQGKSIQNFHTCFTLEFRWCLSNHQVQLMVKKALKKEHGDRGKSRPLKKPVQ